MEKRLPLLVFLLFVCLFHFHLFIFLNYEWLMCEYCVMIQALPRMLNWEQEAMWLVR